MYNLLIEFHSALFEGLHALIGISPWWDTIILFVARDADTYVVAAAMLFILVHQHHRRLLEPRRANELIREMVLITVSVFVAWIISSILKELIGGLRPYEFYETLKPLFVYGGGDTFPSGHATVFSALALMIAMLHRKAGVIFVVLAIAISLGRVISGIHYPIDIFAGWIIGGVVSYTVFVLAQKHTPFQKKTP